MARTRSGLPLPCTTFSGAAITHGTCRRELIEVAKARQAELPPAVHDGMVGERRIEEASLPGVGTNGLDTYSENVPVLRQHL